jgi:hypothetical protein
MAPWKQIRRLHAAALEQQLDQYIDPASGYAGCVVCRGFVSNAGRLGDRCIILLAHDLGLT